MRKPLTPTTLAGNRLGRWLTVVLAVLLSTATAWAQSTANYAFTTSATGSLVDMSTGATNALTVAYHDDDASAVLPIGFTFGFMGTAYTQFSVNSNGQLRLGGTVISGTSAAPASGAAILAPMNGDNEVLATGRVSYKVVAGTNRTLVVEWAGLRIPYLGSTNTTGLPSQVQLVLEENTGRIEYRYGAVINASTGTTRSIFISSGTSAGQIGVVKTFTTTPTYDATVTTGTTTALPDNAVVPVLNSAADGSRTIFAFVPPSGTPVAPGVTAGAFTQAGLTLTITDNSTNEGYFVVSRSTDNVTFTTLGTVISTTTAATGGTYTFAQTGLTAGTTYYYRVTANNEAGGISTNGSTSATTLAAVPICGTKSVGPTGDYASLTAAFAAVNLNGLCGPLVFELQATYVSTVETFPLVYSYAAATATNTVTVRPATGATGLSITGTTASAVMNISGGKYLIIDGRPGGSGTTVSGAATTTDLTIASTNTSGIPLQFTNDATFNTVQHCQVKGVGTSDSSYPDVNFTGTVTTTGNSDNVVQYNNIGDGATTPTTLVYGGNTLNARNTISNNNLFNFYNATSASYGIEVNQAANGWVITGNSIYQTATRNSVAFTHYGIYVVSGNGHTISNNFIGGSAANAGGTPWTVGGTAAAYRFSGIFLTTTTGTATSVQGNTIANFSWLSTSGATTTYGVWSGIYVSAGDTNIGTTTGNTIGTVAGPVTVSISTTGGYSFGISTNSSGTVNIVGNTISNITGVGSAVTIASNVAGILASAGAANTISRNKIYGLASGSGVANISTGIWLNGGTVNNVNNNLVGNLTAATSTSLVAVSGILVAAGTTNNVYYNTVYLNASSTGATFGSSALYLNSTTATLDLRNNILVNTGTAAGTGGYTAAFRRVSGTAGTVPANYATTSNNNLFYAGTPSATNLIYVEGTTTATNAQQTLAAYKVFMATRDQASVSELPPFASTTGSDPTFLHISTTTPTQVESAGQPIASITTDYDGDARNATRPDIGADEGTFQVLDLTGPTIVFTALTSTANAANRPLTVTITDPSGISTTTPPRLFYRKGTSGAFTSVLATSVSGSAYTFTFDYTAVGGVTGGDVIQYYVVAQDVPGNVSSNPTGGTFAANPNSVFQFTILNGLNGIYYVGTTNSPNPARTYATLTAAANAYSNSGLTGAVTFLLLDPSYTAATGETFPIAFFNNLDASATNTLTIRPNTGVSSTVTAAGTGLILASTNYVTIDGSNTVGGTTRNLTLSNTALTASTYPLGLLQQTGQPVSNQNTVVRNVALTGGGATTNTTLGLVVSGPDNDNVTLQNNSILGVTTGISAFGSANASAGGMDNFVLTGNVVGPATATAGQNINATGILVSAAIAPQITNNTVQNVTSAAALVGMQVQNSTAPVLTGNQVLNTVSTGSTASGLIVLSSPSAAITTNTVQTVTAISTALGMTVQSLTNPTVTGNQVLSVVTSGTITTSGAGATGMSYITVTGGQVSQNLVQTVQGNASTAVTAGLSVGSGTTGLVVNRNRILGLTEVNSGGNGAKGIDVATATTNANILISNNFVQVTAASGFGGTTYSNLGIRVQASQSGINIYHNSVNLTGTDVYNGTTISAGLAVVSGATGLDIRNNVFRNSIVNSGNTGAKAYAFYSAAATTAFTNLDFNDYFVSGTQGVLAYFGGTDQPTLAALRTADGKDANSVNVDPAYVSNTDLHTFAFGLNNVGTPLTAVTTDIDGDPRSTTTPDIGADEFTPITTDLASTALIAPSATQGCYQGTETVTVQIRNVGSSPIDFTATPATVSVTVTGPGTPGTFSPVTVNTGTLAPGATQNVTFAGTANLSTAGTYTFAITSTVAGDGNAANNTFTTTITSGATVAVGTLSPATAGICAGSTVTLTLSGAANGNIQFQSSPDNITFTNVAGATSATYTTPGLTATTYYRAQVSCGTTVLTSNVSTITVNNPQVASTNGPVAICSGSTATLTATASTGASVRFFSTATGGTALATTTAGTYTTPALTANTTYYAEAFTGATENVGKTTAIQSDGGVSASNSGLVFTASAPVVIQSATVYNAAPTAGSLSVELRDNTTGALITTVGPFAIPAGSTTALVPTVLPLNLTVPVAGTYRLVTAATPTPPTLYRDYSSGNTYPFTSPSGTVSITSGYSSGATNTYFFFYNLSVSNECIGAGGRTAIQVNVSQPGTAGFSYASAINCAGTATTLTPTLATGATAGTFTLPAGTTGLTINPTTGVVTVATTAVAGSYTVTNTVTNSPCASVTSTASFTITPQTTAGFSYSGSPFCQNASNPTPTITGNAGGTFSAPAAVSINATTGVINLSGSTAGTYTVTYTVAGPCGSSSTQSVTITNPSTAGFAYATTANCTGTAKTLTPTLATGATAGTFTLSPTATGLSVNATTGVVTIGATTPAGTYTVTNAVAANGGCPGVSSTASFTITPQTTATFAYAGSPYCTTGTNPTPTVTGTTGGTFSSTAGLTISATTGTITLSSSTPGNYTVTYTVTGTCGSSSTQQVTITAPQTAGFSYAAGPYCTSGTTNPTVILASGATAGTFTSTAGLTIAANGTVTLSTSTPGVYTVTNTVAASGGCAAVTSTASITINAAPTAGFSYAAGPYCTSGTTNPTVILASGATAGTFSSTTGLTIAANGTITLSSSTPGVYTVTNTVAAANGCAAVTSTTSITINAAPTAGFSYPTATNCAGTATTLTPTLATGATAGTFTLPATTGLTINANTGVVTVGTTAPVGTYVVTNTVAAANGCAQVTGTASFILSGPSTATFSYSGSPYCTTGTNPTPTVTGTAGGTFTASPSGLTINATTGAITLSSSAAGTYTVTYTVAGTCGSSSSQQVTITAPQTAGFSYATATNCAGTATTLTPTLATGATAGTFTLPAGTTGLTINPTTGVVTVAATAAAGVYTVTNTVAASGGCAAVTSTASFTITPQTTATFSYAAGPYCTSGTTNPTPTVTGTTGGTFSATPTGLTLNATTGVVTLSSSTAGTYTVTYTVAGTCGSSSTQSITINAPPTAGFSYAGAPFCVSGTTNPTVTLATGATAGTFTSTTGLTIAANGTITLSSSTPGVYTVTNTVAAANGCAAVTSTTSVTINAAPTAGFSYPTTAVCAGTAATKTPVLATGATAGTFTLPAGTTGLTINATTGVVTIATTAAAGNYTVTNTVAASGGCAAVTSTASFTITPQTTATFSYSGSPYCTTGTNPTPTVTGTTGGTFSAPTGVTINATTGVITLSSSTPGTYTVTYTVAGTCGSSSTQSITINAPPTAGFSYPTAAICAGTATTLTPTLATGATAGTFTLPAGTTGLTINATTGVVTVASTAVAGNYTVTNTVTSGGCATVTSTATFTVSPATTATFSYAGSPYCTTAAAVTPTITGTAGGTFSAAPTGLTISATTGVITPGSSTPGTYTVTYTVAGTCGSSATQTVTITAPATAGFSYATPALGTACAGGNATFTPVLATGATAGTFSVTPAGVTVNPTTGVLSIAGAAAGTYTVTNTVAASGGCAAVTSTATFTVNPLPATPTIGATGTPATGITLTSSSATGNQFYLNGVAVPGATGQTLLVNSGQNNGTYTVVVTSTAGCSSATSAPVAVTVTATTPVVTPTLLTVYPNPTRDGLLTLELTGYQETVQLTILNALGQKVYEGTIAGPALNQKQALNLSQMATGVYLLQARTASGSVETRRIVRE